MDIVQTNILSIYYIEFYVEFYQYPLSRNYIIRHLREEYMDNLLLGYSSFHLFVKIGSGISIWYIVCGGVQIQVKPLTISVLYTVHFNISMEIFCINI